MKIPKESRRQARALFRHCFTDAELDDGRVRITVQQLVTHKPRHYLATLRSFSRLVRLEIERRKALVQSATSLEPTLTGALTETLRRNYGPLRAVDFGVDPQLIGGLRVQVGSDVWDGSVIRRLRALEEAF